MRRDIGSNYRPLWGVEHAGLAGVGTRRAGEDELSEVLPGGTQAAIRPLGVAPGVGEAASPLLDGGAEEC
jgi:hypothetical protein